MAVIAGETYFVVGEDEFNRMVVERLQQLERERLIRVIQRAELHATVHLMNEEHRKAFDYELTNINKQIDEIDARREAMRCLTNELDKPKTE